MKSQSIQRCRGVYPVQLMVRLEAEGMTMDEVEDAFDELDVD